MIYVDNDIIINIKLSSDIIFTYHTTRAESVWVRRPTHADSVVLYDSITAIVMCKLITVTRQTRKAFDWLFLTRTAYVMTHVTAVHVGIIVNLLPTVSEACNTRQVTTTQTPYVSVDHCVKFITLGGKTSWCLWFAQVHLTTSDVVRVDAVALDIVFVLSFKVEPFENVLLLNAGATTQRRSGACIS